MMHCASSTPCLSAQRIDRGEVGRYTGRRAFYHDGIGTNLEHGVQGKIGTEVSMFHFHLRTAQVPSKAPLAGCHGRGRPLSGRDQSMSSTSDSRLLTVLASS